MRINNLCAATLWAVQLKMQDLKVDPGHAGHLDESVVNDDTRSLARTLARASADFFLN